MRTILLFCLLIFSFGFSQIPTDDALRYLFTNGTIENNVLPGANDLITVGNSRVAIPDSDGNANNALDVNTDEFNAGTRGAGNINNGLMSLSFWIKTSTNDSSVRTILSQYGPESFGSYGWNVFLQNGKITLTDVALINGAVITPQVQAQSGIYLADNNWHHIVCIVHKASIFSGGWSYGPQVTLYVDNIFQGSNSSGGASSMPLVYLNPLNFDIYLSKNSLFNDAIDNIRIYNRVVTANEITSLYNEFQSISSSKIYVDINATGANNGYSWIDAFTSLQDALTATSFSNANEIWIAKGTYKPHTSDRTIAFTISSDDVKIYGGFAGNETQLSNRFFGTNETILSGDLLGNDDNNINYINTTRNDNSYTVLNTQGENIELDGLTITGGHANGGSGSATEFRFGGGVYKNGNARNLTITNCKLIKNFSNGGGGALSVGYTASGGTGSLIINNCEFSNNLSALGAVIYSANTSVATVTSSISNSLFSNNKATNTNAAGYAGSSMWLRSYGAATAMISNLTNCTFVNNIDEGTASGMSDANRTTLALTKNTNTNHTATISNCIFWNNKAASGTTARPIGGFIESTISSATITNSIDETNFTGITLSGTSANTSNADPLLTDLVNGYYTLNSGSPAIDTGNNSNVIGTTDVLGNQRIVNATVDMGAFEFQGCVAPSNINVTSITETTATVTWNAGGTSSLNVDLIYVLAGQPISSGTIVSGITTNNYALTSLTASTEYDVYLRANCPSTTVSSWSFAFTFKTTYLGPIYVNQAATVSGDGSSWGSAYITLEEAFVNMTPNGEIYVAQGIYKPSTAGLTDSKKATFLIPTNAKIYGGFNGTETTLSQRDPKTNITILSGDLNGNDNASIVYNNGLRGDNVFHIITLKGALAGIVIDGFTITGGNANGSYDYSIGANSYDDTRGGAICAITDDAANYSIYAEFKNCILEKNTGSDIGVYSQFTLLLNSYISVNFESCIFRNNQSSGSFSNIFLQGRGSNTLNQRVSSYFTNCLFHNNVSNGTSNQGASCITTYQNTTAGGSYTTAYSGMTNCTFANNTGPSGHAISIIYGSNTTIVNSIIYNNGNTTPLYVFPSSGTIMPSGFNNIIQGGTLGGINSNPLFVSSSDFQLSSSSPAINAGNNSYLGAVTTDLNGNTRIVSGIVDLGAYEFDSALTSTTFTSFNDFEVYPNPTSSLLYINTNDVIKTIAIYSLDGKLVVESNENKADVSNLQNGLYVIKVTTSQNEIGTKKFIKR